jgi:hypothetical protein
MAKLNLSNRTPIFHAIRLCAIENCQLIVASGLWPDVAGGRLAARKEPPELFDGAEISDTFWLFARFFPPGGTPRLYGRRTPAATSEPWLYFRFWKIALKISPDLATLILSAHGKTGFVRH